MSQLVNETSTINYKLHPNLIHLNYRSAHPNCPSRSFELHPQNEWASVTQELSPLPPAPQALFTSPPLYKSSTSWRWCETYRFLTEPCRGGCGWRGGRGSRGARGGEGAWRGRLGRVGGIGWVYVWGVRSNSLCELGGVLIYILTEMSGKLETKQLLSKHDLSTGGQLLLFNQESTYGFYERQLEDNIHEILRKFPSLDKEKVRTLLEEIDNNCDVAVQLLKAEEARCSSIVEEKRTEPKPAPRSSKDEEVSFLRQSFLKLYQKTMGMAKEIQELKAKLEKKENENDKLKYSYRLLLEREYSRNYFEDNAPIY